MERTSIPDVAEQQLSDIWNRFFVPRIFKEFNSLAIDYFQNDSLQLTAITCCLYISRDAGRPCNSRAQFIFKYSLI
jgi:hypothetical protein